MATYRRLLPADAAITSALWNRTTVQNSLKNMGYPGVELEDWAFSIASPRTRIFGAFDNSGTLRGVVEFILHRTEREGHMGRWFLDPSLSLANIRTHRDAVLLALWNFLPDDWKVYITFVVPGAVRLREYCDTRFPFIDRDETGWGTVRHYGPLTALALR